jgi:ribosome-binding protein aMBF1 (putative translation factor)
MRVRCSFCGAEYDAAVTRAALSLVDRCERCGRARLQPADGADAEPERRRAPDADGPEPPAGFGGA